MKVAGLLIMRNAAKDLPACLGSIKDQVDVLVAVDTGSEDDSVQVAQSFGARVVSFPWQDDFAAARNFALDQLPDDTDWVVFLDSDESFTPETQGNLRTVLSLPATQAAQVLYILRHNVDEAGKPVLADNHDPRIFRYLPDLRYRDRVHETIHFDDDRPIRMGEVPDNLLALNHVGYAPERQQGKTNRNLKILEEIRASGKSKENLYYYLAGLYQVSERYEESYEAAMESLLHGESPIEGSYEVWRTAMHDCEQLGWKVRQALLCRLAMQRVPSLPDSYMNLALLLMNAGDFLAARPLMAEALRREIAFPQACPREFDHLRPGLEQLWHFLAECDWRCNEEVHVMKSVAEFLPPRAKEVVYFGSDGEDIAQAFCRLQPACRWMPVSPKEPDLKAYGIKYVDVIVFGREVIATLTSGQVRSAASHLAAQGQMVFVVPNPGYLGNVMNLMTGQMPLQPAGDGLRAVQAMIREAGLMVTDVEARRRPEDKQLQNMEVTQNMMRSLQVWYEQLGWNVSDMDVWTDSWIVRTGVESAQPLFVHTVLGEGLVTARVRCAEPDKFLETIPGVRTMREKGRFSLQVSENYPRKICIRQRLMTENQKTVQDGIDLLRRKGFLVLYEIDDNPERWNDTYSATDYFDFWYCHAMLVSTPALAEKMRKYQPEVYVLENQLEALPEPRVYDDAAPVTIFFGALNRQEDWRDIMPVLNKAAKKYGDRLRFRVIADEEFYQALETEHKEYIHDPALKNGNQYVPYEQYIATLHTADIALLPLHDTPFNRMKSDLKFIESAGNGAVVLASPTVYERTVVDGVTGCIYHNVHEFRAKLTRLIEDAAYRHAMAAAAYDYVREHRLLAQHYGDRYALYERLQRRLPELDAAMMQRARQHMGK